MVPRRLIKKVHNYLRNGVHATRGWTKQTWGSEDANRAVEVWEQMDTQTKSAGERVTQRWITKHAREAARACSIVLPDSSILRSSNESTFGLSRRTDLQPYALWTITPAEYRNLPRARLSTESARESCCRVTKKNSALADLPSGAYATGNENVTRHNLGTLRIYQAALDELFASGCCGSSVISSLVSLRIDLLTPRIFRTFW